VQRALRGRSARSLGAKPKSASASSLAVAVVWLKSPNRKSLVMPQLDDLRSRCHLRPRRLNRLDLVVPLSLLVAAGLACSSALAQAETATPIKHVVVIYQENVSFDHYFATYPRAENTPGEPQFTARPGTPNVNGLSGPLLTQNPNSVAPFRFPRSHAATCDQDHEYKAEQEAYNKGLIDRAVQMSGTGSRANSGTTPCSPGDVMGYFDGNTVTAMWSYAQHFAISDNHFATTFGPSTPGAINLVSGQTHGAIGDCARATPSMECRVTEDSLTMKWGVEVIAGTMIGDPQPKHDDCSTRETVEMTGRNVGHLLTARNVTWGFFQGGFKPTGTEQGRAKCGTTHTGSDGKPKADYIPHHQPFQYYEATSNPRHLPPSSVDLIGRNEDQANHQYDLSDFWDAVEAGNMPAVSYLKAPGYQDGHAGYSDPLAEQKFVVETINRLQQLAQWKEMVIIIAYDDSDGWYDHVMPPIVRHSNTEEDALTGPGQCGDNAAKMSPGRCGFGPRLPLLVISPWARENFVDHTLTDQSSILQFIEDNWQLGRLGDGSADEFAGSLLGMFDFGKARRVKVLLDAQTGRVSRAE
jgi:phospholipase C